MIRLYVSCAPEDGRFLAELENHLGTVTRKYGVHVFHRGSIGAGADVEATALQELRSAHLILLLVSADYLGPEEGPCWQDMQAAIAQHRSGEARVVPIVVRACGWRHAPFMELGVRVFPEQPAGAVRAITSWNNHDEAWQSVVDVIATMLKHGMNAAPTPAVRSPASFQQSGSAPAQSVELLPEAFDDGGPTPDPVDDATTRQCAALDAALCERAELRRLGQDTAQVDARIRALRHDLREGGLLVPGDALGDGRYRLLGRLGSGTFAVVWRAFDRATRELVAIKVLHPNQAADPKLMRRFLRGAELMAELSHEGIVRILDRPRQDGRLHYFVMELMHGGDLEKAVPDAGLPVNTAVHVMLRVSEAVAVAHARGVIHRDIKPANVVLDEAGEPKLTDFDLVAGADATIASRVGGIGTFLFAAPESISRTRYVDARADVYGLGMTALFCLYGQTRFEKHALNERDKLIAKLPCSPEMRDVLRKATAHKPEDRFADAAALCSALRAALQRPPVPPKRYRLMAYLLAALGTGTLALMARGLACNIDPKAETSDGGHAEPDVLTPVVTMPTATRDPIPVPTSVCENTHDDPNNCGFCGRSCMGGACREGKCQPAVLVEHLDGNPTSMVLVGDCLFWTVQDRHRIYFVCDVNLHQSGMTTDHVSGPAIKADRASVSTVIFYENWRTVDLAHAPDESALLVLSYAELGVDGTPLAQSFLSSCPLLPDSQPRDPHIYTPRVRPDCGNAITWAIGQGRARHIQPHQGMVYATLETPEPTRSKVLSVDIIEPDRGIIKPVAVEQHYPSEIAVDDAGVHWINRGAMFAGYFRDMFTHSSVLARSINTDDDGAWSAGQRVLATGQADAVGLTFGGDEGEFLYWATRGDYVTNSYGAQPQRNGAILRLRKRCAAARCEPEVLASGALSPRAIAVDEKFVYWTDRGEVGSGNVYRMPRDGGNRMPIADSVNPDLMVVNRNFVFWVSDPPRVPGAKTSTSTHRSILRLLKP